MELQNPSNQNSEASRLSLLKMEAFLERVKGKMQSAEYTTLLGYLNEFNQGKIDVDGLKEVLKEKYPDLCDEFQCVLGFSNDLTRARGVESAERSDEVKEKPLESYETKDHMAKALEFCQKVMKKTSSREYLAFLKTLSDYGNGEISIADLKTKIADEYEDFKDDFDGVLEFYTNLNRPSSSLDSKKEINKPNQEMGKVKHSYRLRPKQPSPALENGNKPGKENGKVKENSKHQPKRPSSSSEISNKGKRSSSSFGMDNKGKEVENVTGSWDLPGYLSGVPNGGSFSRGLRRVRRNEQATDEKNTKEDMLFEMDMRKAWMRSCKKNAIKLFEAINEGVIEEGKMEGIVKKHLIANNLAYIQKMYDKDYGSRIAEYLLHCPQHVLPSIIRRLKQHDTSPPVCPHCDHLEYESFDFHKYLSIKPKYIFEL